MAASAPDWRVVYLRALGAKPTQPALDFLAKWQPFEGGATKNNATNNYLNTTQRMPGSSDINEVGVQAYGTLAQGAQAFAKTLTSNPNYAPLVSFLKTGQGDPSPGLSEWLSGSPNSPHGMAYAAKVMGNTPQTSGGETSGSTSLEPTGLQTPQSVPLTTPDATAQIQAQARSNLSQIAMGSEKPTDELANIASLMKTLKVSTPQVNIPTAAQGGSTLDDQAANLVHKYLGVKYTWGGTTAAGGFDCSGLVQTVWKQLGVNIPRTSEQQFAAGKPVAAAALQPGDEVFFVGSDGSASAPGHEGMYIGDGKYIAAPHTGAVVSVFNLADAKDYVGGRRFA